MQESVMQLEGEKNEEINQLQQRIEEMQLHIENLCKQHEEVLLRAENDKQQALLIGEYKIPCKSVPLTRCTITDIYIALGAKPELL